MFTPLPDKPDHPALELEILELWEREGTFERLRELNRGGPRFSFVDGPVTANRTVGVHTAWGRTLKDVFQRYKALRGHDQRYQNGFDCQGLWIEVGVERSARAQLEARDRGVRPRRVRPPLPRGRRPVVGGHRPRARSGSASGWTGARTTSPSATRTSSTSGASCSSCTSAAGSTWATARPSGARAAAPRSRSTSSRSRASTRTAPTRRSSSASRCSTGRSESLVIWTTTPWTLPANVAAAVKPDAEYGRRENGEWVAVGAVPGRGRSPSGSAARSSSAGATRARSTSSGPARTVEHRVIPWDEVTLDEGTGIVHIAPGCGAEDFELVEVHDLPVLTPVDEAGRFYDDYGWLHGLSTVEAADQIVGWLGEHGFLVEAGLYEHRYPHCWRCDTPLIFRVSDDWFIAVDELRPPLLDANQDGRVDARVHGQADGRLAAEHGRLEHLAPALLRAAAALLPVRVRAPERDRLEGRARGAGDSAGSTSSRSCAGRGSTRCRSRASSAARRCAGSPRSATSGSTPASSPSRRSAGRTPSTSRRATRPAPPRA